MKKRITSLLLVFCMLVLAVPVFVLPTSAAELPETYTTTFEKNGVNYPTLSADNSAVTYHGGWTIGSTESTSGVFHEMSSVDVHNHILNYNGNQWVNGGFYVDATSNIDIGGAMTITPAAYNTSVRYTAEYTGTVNISVASLYFRNQDRALFAIFHNGVMIWPTANGSYTVADFYDPTSFDTSIFADTKATFDGTAVAYSGDWYRPGIRNKQNVAADITGDALLNLDVVNGDTIEFVAKRNPNTAIPASTTQKKDSEEQMATPLVEACSNFGFYQLSATVSYQSIRENPCKVYFINPMTGEKTTVNAPIRNNLVSLTVPETPEDVLGYFEMAPDGSITAASAYNGTPIPDGKTFYAFPKTASMSPTTCWTFVSDGSFHGYTGGWSFGTYNLPTLRFTVPWQSMSWYTESSTTVTRGQKAVSIT